MNLKNAMPNKFDDMVELWRLATVDEAFPCYMPKEQSALEVSSLPCQSEKSDRARSGIIFVDHLGSISS